MRLPAARPASAGRVRGSDIGVTLAWPVTMEARIDPIRCVASNVASIPSSGGLPQAVLFGPSDRRLAGFYHPAAGGKTRSPAIVLCNALGYELMSAHRTYRHLAMRLALAGFPTLRFDYRGTGNSTGTPRDPRRVRAWIDDIHAAVREVRSRSGVAAVALFGLRFGASLATVAAVEAPEVEALALWAPIVSGRAAVRELRAFRLLGDPKARRPDDGEEIGGYYFSRETLTDLSGLELVTRTDRDVARVLVVPRGEQATKEESALAEHWRAARAEVSIATSSGYAAMMRDSPYEAVVPESTLDAVVQWFEDGSTPVDVPRPAPTSAPSMALTVGAGAGAVRETPIHFGRDQRLYGVIAEPSSPSTTERPAVLLLNVGADNHVGPHRMNTEIGRELAGMGHVTLRFDVGGLGESAPSSGKGENRLYRMDSVDDVQEAMSALERWRGCSRFVLVGLCSGAFLAFHAAARDPRVIGQALVNMFAFEWKEGDPIAPTERSSYASNRFYVRALLDRRVWQRALRGEVDVKGIAAAVGERYAERLVLGARSMSARLLGRWAQSGVERTLHAVCDRGARTLMVFSESDGGLDMIARYIGVDAERMARRPEFSIEIVRDVDHTFSTMASQERLRAVLYRHLDTVTSGAR
jgi:pimeloyl-ACP methyl ester carboxylesterase